MIGAIKMLADSGTSLFYQDQRVTVMIENFADFLYRLKDRHPYSNSEMIWLMDVFYTIMEFLIPNGYLPSAALLKEYSESKATRELNTLPTRKYLNSKFDWDYQMSEEDYERLRKRFDSRPPFVFYFDPSFELQEKVEDGCVFIKGFIAEHDVSVDK